MKTLLILTSAVLAVVVVILASIGFVFMVGTVAKPAKTDTCDEINARRNAYTGQIDVVCEIKMTGPDQVIRVIKD